jgi:hypothetical protein
VRSAQCAARRETPKAYKKKKKGGNDRGEVFFPLTFWQKVCDMYHVFFPKGISGVFELPLLRNAPKRHFKKKMPRL